MKIVVTGCAGFIGSHLCEKLLTQNHVVYGIDIMNEYYDVKQKEQNLKIISNHELKHNFIFKVDDLITTKIISDVQPDVVVNLGAMAGVRYSLEHPSIYIKTNIEGQVHLMDECVKNNVKLFVYASSSSVYGLNTKVPFCETDEIILQNSPYACSKKAGEDFATLYNKLYGLNVIGLRFFTVYGPRGRPDMAPFKFINAITNNKIFDKFGDGNSYRDYTYIDDIIDGIVSAINNKHNKTCEVYNLGNNKPVSLNEFIETCEHITGKLATYNIKPIQKGDVPVTYANIDKATKDLDYLPKTSLYEGLKRTYKWINTELDKK
jgi:UDP-glucuronate 4-epimerase